MKKPKFSLYFSTASAICLFLFIFVLFSWQYHSVYPVDQLQPVTMEYSYTRSLRRPLRYAWLYDSNGTTYRYMARNLHPFGVNDSGTAGNIVHLLIEPDNKNFIAYLEMNGVVYFSTDDYYSIFSHDNSKGFIFKIFSGFIWIVQLISLNYRRNKAFWRYHSPSEKQKRLEKQENRQRLNSEDKLHPTKQLQKKKKPN